MPARGATLLLYVACALLLGCFAHGYLENTDSEITLHAARAFWLRGDPGLVRGDETHLLGEGAVTWPAEHAICERFITHPTTPVHGMTGRNGRHYVWYPIGHQVLFVPAVALGEMLDARFPEPAQRFLDERGPLFGPFFWSRFVASFVSPLFAAGSIVLLLGIALRLGANRREALLAVACATLTTQFLPGSSETMSNVPGAFFLVATVAAIVAYASEAGRPRHLLVAGLATGAAVLVRYPILVSLAPFLLWAAVVAVRRRPRDLVWLVAGGLPACVALLAANWLRFGSITETGYSRNAGFGDFDFLHGFASILVAPGKGLVWFTPAVVLAVVCLVRRRVWGAPVAASVAAFLLPLLLYSTVTYWAAGQCWGIRYLTIPTVVLIVVTFARARPWRSWPRAFVAVAVLGAVVSLGGVATLYTAQQQFAFRAATEVWGPQPNLDNNVNWSPRLSPLHSHWTYAWLTARGRIRPGDSDGATEAMFGVDVPEPVALPLYATDAHFRHWWWNALAFYWPGFPRTLVLAAWLGAMLLAFAVGVPWWLRSNRQSGAGEAAVPDAAPESVEALR